MSKVKFKYWIQAARPKTLLVSMAPVIMSVAIASMCVTINWLPAVICLIFAVMAQILSNFVNDYADGLKGPDNERLGPQYLISAGFISQQQMRSGIIVWGIMTFIVGCTLLYYGGWILLPFGIVIMLCAVAYSGGPFPLSRHALGDVAVLLFYGIAPVVLTFFIQTGYVNWQIIIAGLAIGVVVDNLLIVNNYRDAENDAKNGKKTTVTMFGKTFMRYLFYLNPIIAIILIYLVFKNHIILYYFIPFIIYSIFVSCKFAKAKGKEFNKLIGMAPLEAIIFALTVVIYII
ncbi:MAG: 1,4-dihydroxy-2-naphthoate octaprenyltransferase [Bacteroidales bacterium]|nr:1,4-dihydroxy-2-naphthoate octaprenyltransferase [Bacteroidales bacterium]